MESGERAYYEKRAPWITPPSKKTKCLSTERHFSFSQYEKNSHGYE